MSPSKKEDSPKLRVSKAPPPITPLRSSYIPQKPPPPIPELTDPKNTTRKNVQRRLDRSYQSKHVFLKIVEEGTRGKFIKIRPTDEIPYFWEFEDDEGIEVLLEVFRRLPREFQDSNEIRWFFASRWKGEDSELHAFLIAAGVWKFILLHCKDVEEGNSEATHYQETETREVGRGTTERREPADTFKLVLNDYTHIKYNGKSVHLKPTAAQILKYMSEDCREQDVEPREAHNALSLKAEPWRDLFRHNGLWDTLIIKGKKPRTRRLSVYP